MVLVLAGASSQTAGAQWLEQRDGVWYQNNGNLIFDPWTPLSDKYDADDMAALSPVLERIRDETATETIHNIKAFGGDASCGKSAQAVIMTAKDDLVPQGWDLDMMNSVDPLNVIVDDGTIHTVSMFTSPKGNKYIIDRYTGRIEIIEVADFEGSNQVYAKEGETSLLDMYYFALGNSFKFFAPDRSNVHFKGDKTCPVPDEGDEEETDVVTSMDPNDKLGLGGAGASRYLQDIIPMNYRIRFENADSASAPAQEVIVIDDLDLNVFDIETLTLGEIGFGDTKVAVPAGLKSYSTTVDLRPEIDIVLRVVAGLESSSGRLVWRLSSIDPDTGELPADPFEGFLPPNVLSPEGEGYVEFTIRPKEGLPTGTTISNFARIYFDLNEPIDTPPWENVIDRSSPQSNIVELSEQRADTTIVVSWQGSDMGAGVESYAVYMSEDGGEFKPWIRRTEETSAVFSPAPDVPTTYSFYTIARDAVGNVEAPKTEGEASTRIVVSVEEIGGVDLPVAYALRQNYPNPASASTTIEFDLPEAGFVRLSVYDLLGREIAVPVSGDKAAGSYRVTLDTGKLAAGQYFYRIKASGYESTLQFVVVR